MDVGFSPDVNSIKSFLRFAVSVTSVPSQIRVTLLRSMSGLGLLSATLSLAPGTSSPSALLISRLLIFTVIGFTLL